VEHGRAEDAAVPPPGDRAARDLGGEVEGAIGVVAHAGEIDEAAAAGVHDARSLIGHDALAAARLQRQRAFVVLMGAELADVEHVFALRSPGAEPDRAAPRRVAGHGEL
jgi:hypothetical protein